MENTKKKVLNADAACYLCLIQLSGLIVKKIKTKQGVRYERCMF